LAHAALFARLKCNDIVFPARGSSRFSPHCHASLQQHDQVLTIATG